MLWSIQKQEFYPLLAPALNYFEAVKMDLSTERIEDLFFEQLKELTRKACEQKVQAV